MAMAIEIAQKIEAMEAEIVRTQGRARTPSDRPRRPRLCYSARQATSQA